MTMNDRTTLRGANPVSISRETRIEVVESAVRWARNMLVEVNSNHGTALSDEKQAALRRAISALGDFT